MDRFERQRALFGDAGQEKLAASCVAVVGLGGLGSFIAMELAYLGVGELLLIDHDRLERSNRNRLVGAWHRHEDGKLKVEIAEELIHAIDPALLVRAVPLKFEEPVATEALKGADYVMGAVDRDGERFRLNQFCCEASRRLIDSASDTLSDQGRLAYGGRVCCAFPETGCLMCLDVLDPNQVREDLASPEERADQEAIYGVKRALLERGGPSVVSVNGVVASLAVTEFMVAVTGLRAARALVEYRGDVGVVRKSTDPREPGCYFCSLRQASGS